MKFNSFGLWFLYAINSNRPDLPTPLNGFQFLCTINVILGNILEYVRMLWEDTIYLCVVAFLHLLYQIEAYFVIMEEGWGYS